MRSPRQSARGGSDLSTPSLSYVAQNPALQATLRPLQVAGRASIGKPRLGSLANLVACRHLSLTRSRLAALTRSCQQKLPKAKSLPILPRYSFILVAPLPSFRISWGVWYPLTPNPGTSRHPPGLAVARRGIPPGAADALLSLTLSRSFIQTLFVYY